MLPLTAINGVAPTPLTELHIRGLTSGYEHMNPKPQGLNVLTRLFQEVVILNSLNSRVKQHS